MFLVETLEGKRAVLISEYHRQQFLSHRLQPTTNNNTPLIKLLHLKLSLAYPQSTHNCLQRRTAIRKNTYAVFTQVIAQSSTCIDCVVLAAVT
jgi:hypothetical protein